MSADDPFTQTQKAIFDALLAFPQFAELVRVGNRLSSVQRSGVPRIDKPRGTPADYAKPGAYVASGELKVSEAGHRLRPFGSNSRIAEAAQSFAVSLTTAAVDSVPLNRLKWRAMQALYLAGDDLGLPFVRGWDISDAGEEPSSTNPDGTTRQGWVTAFNVNVEMYWPRATLAVDDFGPVAVLVLSGAEYQSPTNARGWNPNIFPGYDDTAPLATRQSVWLAGLNNWLDADTLPKCAAIRARALSFHDGLNGQKFTHPVDYNGDPRTYADEAPQASVRSVTAKLAAADLGAWTIMRPTVQDPAGVNVPPFGQAYEVDPVATVQSKISTWKADGGTGAYMDSFVKDTSYTRFTAADLNSWLATAPGFQMTCELWDENTYPAIPGVRVLHWPPDGTDPGGYLPGPAEGGHTDRPEWDYRGHYYISVTRDDPADSANATRLAAAYARGAQLYLPVQNWPRSTFGDEVAAHWRANYVPA